MPPFSLKVAAVAAAVWLGFGAWLWWEMLDDDWSHTVVAAWAMLVGSGGAAHAGLASFQRFRALAGRGRISAVCGATLVVFATVRAVRRSPGSGSLILDVLLAFVPALAMSALAVYAADRVEHPRVPAAKPAAKPEARHKHGKRGKR